MAWSWTSEEKTLLAGIWLAKIEFLRCFQYLADLPARVQTVDIRDISRAADLPYDYVLDFARSLGQLSFCSFLIGRKGYPSRLQFYHVDATEVGKVAVGEQQVAEDDENVSHSAEVVPQFRADDVTEQIAEAKRSLAAAIGVEVDAVRINVQLKGAVVISG